MKVFDRSANLHTYIAPVGSRNDRCNISDSSGRLLFHGEEHAELAELAQSKEISSVRIVGRMREKLRRIGAVVSRLIVNTSRRM